MNSATLALIADLQSQIETLNARLERVERRTDEEWIGEICRIAYAASEDDGLRLVE